MMNKLMKKVAIVLAAATMAIAGTTIAASANDGLGIDAMQTSSYTKVIYTVSAENGTYYVNNDIGLNVRTAPSKEAVSLGGLNRGDAVNVTGRVYENGAYTGWVQINFNGQTAYVRDCLQTTKPAPIPAAPAQTGVNPTYTWIKETHSANTTQEKAARGEMSHDNDTFTACVSYGYLALRSSAVTDPANEIGQIANGSMVQVQQYGTQFDYVYVPSLGMYGYVNNDYLA